MALSLLAICISLLCSLYCPLSPSPRCLVVILHRRSSTSVRAWRAYCIDRGIKMLMIAWRAEASRSPLPPHYSPNCSPHLCYDAQRGRMHLTEKIASQKGPFHTYEFFPPRTEAGLVNLLDRIRRLCSGLLPDPLAVSVTWGAGGGTADRSLGLAEEVKKMGVDVVLHLTCTNMPKAKVDQALSVRASLLRQRLC